VVGDREDAKDEQDRHQRVRHKGLRIAAVIANNFYCVVVAVACLYAIVRVSLRGRSRRRSCGR
jgi:hypothetical protein